MRRGSIGIEEFERRIRTRLAEVRMPPGGDAGINPVSIWNVMRILEPSRGVLFNKRSKNGF
jgi:hypothetical protein